MFISACFKVMLRQTFIIRPLEIQKKLEFFCVLFYNLGGNIIYFFRIKHFINLFLFSLFFKFKFN